MGKQREQKWGPRRQRRNAKRYEAAGKTEGNAQQKEETPVTGPCCKCSKMTSITANKVFICLECIFKLRIRKAMRG